MQERWVRKNVNLHLLSKRIESFFAEAGFRTLLKSNGEFEISGIFERGEPRKVNVVVEGKPEDFTVKFQNLFEKDLLVKLSSVITMVGFGFLIRKNMESYDYYKDLEEKFWFFVAGSIAELFGSSEIHQ
jgi:hypothetical protein